MQVDYNDPRQFIGYVPDERSRSCETCGMEAHVCLDLCLCLWVHYAMVALQAAACSRKSSADETTANTELAPTPVFADTWHSHMPVTPNTRKNRLNMHLFYSTVRPATLYARRALWSVTHGEYDASESLPNAKLIHWQAGIFVPTLFETISSA